jgi:RNA polymerase sigma factor (TIGR02999 family)
MASPADITSLLAQSARGDDAAFEQLFPILYDELHRMAERSLSGERAGHTLQPTALVNEAYLRLFDAEAMDWNGRAHFVAIAALTMRKVLVDHARARGRQKRGSGARRCELDEDQIAVESWDPAEILALNDAIEELGGAYPRPAKVVDLRYFGGLSLEETAEVLGVSTQTVKVDWRFARAWLNEKLGE